MNRPNLKINLKELKSLDLFWQQPDYGNDYRGRFEMISDILDMMRYKQCTGQEVEITGSQHDDVILVENLNHDHQELYKFLRETGYTERDLANTYRDYDLGDFKQ